MPRINYKSEYEATLKENCTIQQQLKKFRTKELLHILISNIDREDVLEYLLHFACLKFGIELKELEEGVSNNE